MNNEWAPRVGFAWDFTGDGTSKLYGSVGRFYFSLPTDLNVRVFTANSGVSAYNYYATSTAQFGGPHCSSAGQTGCVPRDQNFQGGSANGEPVEVRATKASYQDEATIGVEKALDPTLSDRPERNLPLSRPHGRGSLRPQRRSSGLRTFLLRAVQPGRRGQARRAQYPTCNGSGNPTDPNAGG